MVIGIGVDDKWAGGPYSKCILNIVSFPIVNGLIDCCVFGMLPGRKVWNRASTVWVNGKSCWPDSFSAWIADFMLYTWAGPGLGSIFCVHDPIRGRKRWCPMTQRFILKVRVRVMFAVSVSRSRTQGCSILHTITRRVMSGLSAFHLAWPIALPRTACTMSGMMCRYILWRNIFVNRQFNLC